jgi:hypothetical protein
MTKLIKPAESFVIDRSKPPYEVPCPECLAFALEPCKSQHRVIVLENGRGRLRWPADARLIPEPHAPRWKHWEDHPEYRVKAIL